MKTSSRVILAGLVLACALGSAREASAQTRHHRAHAHKIRKPAEENPAQKQARVQHAKELLGVRYKKVTAAASKTSIREFIEKTTERLLAKKFKKQAPQISQAILEESKRYGFDPIFLVAVIQTESSFSPVARGTSGEIGLMQLMPDTGNWIAHQAGAKSIVLWKGSKTLYDPVMNIRLGAAYLSLLREQFGSDGRLYIPAYNMGPRKLKLAVSQQVIPALYAKRVMKKYLRFYHQIQARADQAGVREDS
jgi:soluble lytic murein transglycosylase